MFSERGRIWWTWGGYLGALIGLGIALEIVLPPAPRFVLRDPNIRNPVLSADGKILTALNDFGHGWDSLRSWDTFTGGERRAFFKELVSSDPAGFAQQEPYCSPDGGFWVLPHPGGLALADVVAQKEWPAAVAWVHARQGPRPFSPLYRVLQEPMNIVGLQKPMTLQQALDWLSERSAGKLVFAIDQNALTNEMGKKPPDLHEREVCLPPDLDVMPAELALRRILQQAADGAARYVLRHGRIEITTFERSGVDQIGTHVFSSRGSFVAVPEGKSPVSKLHIVECATGQELATFPLFSYPPLGDEQWEFFGFTADEELLFFFASDKEKPVLKLWNTRTKCVVRSFPETSFAPHTLIWGPDSHRFLEETSGPELFDLRSGERRRCFDDPAPAKAPNNIRPFFYHFMFSPDNRTLVGITANEIQIWDIEAGKKRGVIKRDDDGPGAFWDHFISADSRIIAKVHWEHGFTAWNLENVFGS